MHTDMKKPTGSANYPAGHTDSAIVVSAAAAEKEFADLCAAFAMRGFELRRLSDGALLAMRWGMARDLIDMQDAREFLARIGGRL